MTGVQTCALPIYFTNDVVTGNTNGIANKARDNSPQGSRFRAMLYELAGAHTAAADEYDKLGVGAVWTQGITPDGQTMTIKQAKDGRAIEAINPQTGEHITDPAELAKYNGGGMAGAKAGGANMIYDAPDGTTHLVNEMTLQIGRAHV